MSLLFANYREIHEPHKSYSAVEGNSELPVLWLPEKTRDRQTAERARSSVRERALQRRGAWAPRLTETAAESDARVVNNRGRDRHRLLMRSVVERVGWG